MKNDSDMYRYIYKYNELELTDIIRLGKYTEAVINNIEEKEINGNLSNNDLYELEYLNQELDRAINGYNSRNFEDLVNNEIKLFGGNAKIVQEHIELINKMKGIVKLKQNVEILINSFNTGSLYKQIVSTKNNKNDSNRNKIDKHKYQRLETQEFNTYKRMINQKLKIYKLKKETDHSEYLEFVVASVLILITLGFIGQFTTKAGIILIGIYLAVFIICSTYYKLKYNGWRIVKNRKNTYGKNTNNMIQLMETIIKRLENKEEKQMFIKDDIIEKESMSINIERAAININRNFKHLEIYWDHAELCDENIIEQGIPDSINQAINKIKDINKITEPREYIKSLAEFEFIYRQHKVWKI